MTDEPKEQLNIEKVTMDVVAAKVQHILNQELLYAMSSETLELHAEKIGENLAIQLIHRFPQENIEDFKVPSSWWQMLKEEHAPKWFLKRYPVKFNWYNVKAAYNKVSVPEWQPQIIITKYKKGELFNE